MTHRYFYIDVDKSNNEILCLLDGCRSEDDMRNILRENEIPIIEVEDEPSVYENEFRVCDVADDIADYE